MLNRLFPEKIDNTYRGHALAIWIFVPIVLVKLMMGVNVSGLNPWMSNRNVLKNADGVPLDTFGAEAASTVVFMFASWGFCILLLSLLSLIVAIRYRAMIPLMFLFLTIEQIGRRGIGLANPIIKAAESEGLTPAFFINWGFTAALAIGLLLSLVTPRAKPARET